MTTALGGSASQFAALAVSSAQPGAAVTQFAALAVYVPPQAHLARVAQEAALVPYSRGVYALPRATQLAAVIVYTTGVPNQKRTRAWTYTLDGHTFYVLNLGPEGTFLFDAVTQQWCEFKTEGYGQWNMLNGVQWGDRIVGGDSLTSQLWELSPSAVLDENWRDIDHVVTGALATRARTFVGCDALRLTASFGKLDEVNGATMKLRFSDDVGNTWSSYFPITLTQGDTTGELAWRSLGSFMAPGRVFEISDVGGLIRIDGCDAFLNGFDDDKPEK